MSFVLPTQKLIKKGTKALNLNAFTYNRVGSGWEFFVLIYVIFCFGRFKLKCTGSTLNFILGGDSLRHEHVTRAGKGLFVLHFPRGNETEKLFVVRTLSAEGDLSGRVLGQFDPVVVDQHDFLGENGHQDHGVDLLFHPKPSDTTADSL